MTIIPAPHQAAADWFFHTQQVGWGLRGDPVLWRHMHAYFAQKGIPEGEAEFRTLIAQAFEDITDQALASAPDTFGVKALKRREGGMSNGMVSASTWRRHLIPILIARHRHSKQIADFSEAPLNRYTAAPYLDPK